MPLPRGYIHTYSHYFQTFLSQKPLGQSKPNFMWSLHGKRGHDLLSKNNGHGQVTKIATTPIFAIDL